MRSSVLVRANRVRVRQSIGGRLGAPPDGRWSTPYGEIKNGNPEKRHTDHRQRSPSAGWIDDRVREQIDRRKAEQRGHHRVARRTERWIVIRAATKHVDRRHA